MDLSKIRVSSRALDPLSHHDDPSKTFCDSTQAKATTATQLFRDREMLQALRRIVVPAYMEKRIRKGLEIWSAGCSSGEEAYSLAAIGLYELMVLQEPLRFTVYGTDISDDQLAKAKAGRYLTNSSSATVPKYLPVLSRFATVDSTNIIMNQDIRSHIKFGKFDLRRRPRNHQFDYIVCNHVFQYYDAPAQLNFVHNFLSVLKPGGVMFIEGLCPETFGQSSLERIGSARNLYRLP